MKIFVVNLPDSTERGARIRKQLTPLEVDFQFFPALDQAAGLKIIAGFDARQFLVNGGRPANPCDIGRYASHLSLWRKCVALGQPIVIMEDDAKLRPNFARAFVETRELIDQYGFIRLEADGPGRCIKKLPMQLAGPFTLFYYTRYPFGATCYAVSPPVAAAFISVGEVVTAPVDLLIKRFWRHRQPLFGLSPPPVDGSQNRSDSTTARRGEERGDLRLAGARLMTKLASSVGRASFNLAYRQGRFTRNAPIRK